MSLRDRIGALERRLPAADPREVIVVKYVSGPLETEPPNLGPVELWLTYREELAMPMEPGTCVKIVHVDPFAEYERRHGLPMGTLSEHPLHGQVGFDELLRAATGQNRTEPGADGRS